MSGESRIGVGEGGWGGVIFEVREWVLCLGVFIWSIYCIRY